MYVAPTTINDHTSIRGLFYNIKIIIGNNNIILYVLNIILENDKTTTAGSLEKKN